MNPLSSIASLFSIPIHFLGEAIVMGDLGEATRHASEFGGDLIALEAFVNHFHLEDYVLGIPLGVRTKRQQLLKLGEALIEVWSERLAMRLNHARILFYLGGSQDVVLRWHVEREKSTPWVPLDNTTLFRRERMRVFRLKGKGLERVI